MDIPIHLNLKPYNEDTIEGILKRKEDAKKHKMEIIRLSRELHNLRNEGVKDLDTTPTYKKLEEAFANEVHFTPIHRLILKESQRPEHPINLHKSAVMRLDKRECEKYLYDLVKAKNEIIHGYIYSLRDIVPRVIGEDGVQQLRNIESELYALVLRNN